MIRIYTQKWVTPVLKGLGSRYFSIVLFIAVFSWDTDHWSVFNIQLKLLEEFIS